MSVYLNWQIKPSLILTCVTECTLSVYLTAVEICPQFCFSQLPI